MKKITVLLSIVLMATEVFAGTLKFGSIPDVGTGNFKKNISI